MSLADCRGKWPILKSKAGIGRVTTIPTGYSRLLRYTGLHLFDNRQGESSLRFYYSVLKVHGDSYENPLRDLLARVSYSVPHALFRAPHGCGGEQRQCHRKRYFCPLGENRSRGNQEVARWQEHRPCSPQGLRWRNRDAATESLWRTRTMLLPS